MESACRQVDLAQLEGKPVRFAFSRSRGYMGIAALPNQDVSLGSANRVQKLKGEDRSSCKFFRICEPYRPKTGRKLAEDELQKLIKSAPESNDGWSSGSYVELLVTGESAVECTEVQQALKEAESSQLLRFKLESYSSSLDKLMSRLDD